MQKSNSQYISIPFGKYKGKFLNEICIQDPNYLTWLVSPCPRGRWVEKYPHFADLMALIWYEYSQPFHEEDENHQRLVSVTTEILAKLEKNFLQIKD